MVTTTADLNPPRCQVQSCGSQTGTSSVLVDVDGLKILVVLCDVHKQARAQAAAKS